ncbi:MAG TPA: copper ion binding protein, partial [Bryobacteraceae bacterium]|nr:copper ion binding protein [Bryobacteraceae bacterium]
MTCASCVGHVEKALHKLPGISQTAVNLLSNEATVTYDAAQTNPTAIAAAIEDAGYTVPQPETALTLDVQGMTCAACVGHVEKALHKVPGVTQASVNLLANEARVAFDPARTSPAALIAAVEDAGYHAAVNVQTNPSEPAEPDGEYAAVRRYAFISLLLGALAMGSMPFAGHDSLPARYAQLAAAIFVITVPGRAYYVRAFQGLRHGRFDMSTLIAVGTGSAFLYSLAAT